MSMDRVLRIMNVDVTVHGFRSTFKDWAEDTTGFSSGVIEAALAHLVGDETERAYRRGDALEKRRRLMEAWADFALSKVRPPRYLQPDAGPPSDPRQDDGSAGELDQPEFASLDQAVDGRSVHPYGLSGLGDGVGELVSHPPPPSPSGRGHLHKQRVRQAECPPPRSAPRP